MEAIQENEYNEVDYVLTVKHKSGESIPESDFNRFTSEIEEKMSDEKFLVVVKKYDREEVEIE